MTGPDDALAMLQREVLEAALQKYLAEVEQAHQQAVCPWLRRLGPERDELKRDGVKRERRNG